MFNPKILVIDDEENIRLLIKNEFSIEGFDVTVAKSGEEGLKLFNDNKYDLVLLDLKLPKMNGIETLKKLKQKVTSTEVIMMTGYGDIETAVMSIKLGARDYVPKPFKLDMLLAMARQVIEDNKIKFDSHIGSEVQKKKEFIECPSPAMQKIYKGIQRAAPTDNTILILGETGTGKDILAKQIHYYSSRNNKPFVMLDCGMLSHNLAESELYGHQKGAFSGALEQKKGLVEKSDNGTLFLNEIGNIDLDLQKKFLRFLETGRFRMVGDTKEKQIDTRIILATNINIEDAVQEGVLRKDLLYRMDVISFTIPPLRDRPEDIAPLTECLLNQYGKNKVKISPKAMKILTDYLWPGNIRELKSVIIKSVLFSDSNMIMPKDIPSHLARNKKIFISKTKNLEEMEKNHVIAVLNETKGNQTRAAEILGINRKTLYKKIHKYKRIGVTH